MTITWKHKPLAGSKPRPWEDRRYAECAFPLDTPTGLFSCCEPVKGELSYCSAHCAVMFYPNSPTNRADRTHRIAYRADAASHARFTELK